MSLPPEIIARWKANAQAAGVRLTDEDIERITAAGLPERLAHLERIIAEADANNLPPDFLADRNEGAYDDA